ncbi:bucentaur or craniofacial development-domain-containing protein [Cerioporus squamosus]|nr:bucentaur or craniofacial development-domain-containing protein [Cerioporus squamosus]
MVKVVKRYRFAGEEVTEVKEVPADTDEAKKWPRWTPSADTSAGASPKDASISEAAFTASASETSSAASPAPVKPPAKRTGPRKAKSKLADIPSSQKEPVKKLTTLDKSAMDWRAHVEGESSQPIKEELDANRRGGGYLEKVEFLQRVEARKEEVLDASKGKRRR